MFVLFFFFQAEDGIRDLVRSRGLGDVYKRQIKSSGDDRPPDFEGLDLSGLDLAHFYFRDANLALSLIHI